MPLECPFLPVECPPPLSPPPSPQEVLMASAREIPSSLFLVQPPWPVRCQIVNIKHQQFALRSQQSSVLICQPDTPSFLFPIPGMSTFIWSTIDCGHSAHKSTLDPAILEVDWSEELIEPVSGWTGQADSWGPQQTMASQPRLGQEVGLYGGQ